MAISRTRIRMEYHPKAKLGENWAYDPARDRWNLLGTVYLPSLNNTSVKRQEICVDETHPGPPWKSGGPLWLKRQEFPNGQSSESGTYICESKVYMYKGAFGHVLPSNMNTVYSSLAQSAGNYGATAWNRFRPTKPKASVGQFVGELRDFPSLFKFFTNLRTFIRSNRGKSISDLFKAGTRDVGGTYLNYQFGWVPFVNDIIKFYRAQQKIERSIAFIRKNNGKWIKRGGTVSESKETTVESLTSRLRPTLNTAFYYPPYTLSPTKLVARIEQKVWFKARMKFWIPQLHVDKAEDVWSSALIRRLYGAEITIALLWELLPWSWMADWFGNVGDVLQNMSLQAYDNLAAKYAYVMRSHEIKYSYETDQVLRLVDGPYHVRISTPFIVESKERVAASPYGFGVTWENFSTYQLAILAALGLSRVR